MPRLEIPHHGATDSGPAPLLDFSSNAHPLGPCPAVLEAVRSHDPTRYPDPSYTALRDQLGAHHRVEADRIVVGAGAAELIHRLVRHRGGPVAHPLPGFGEYRHAALCAGVAAHPFASIDDPVVAGGLVFLCLPNNPDGACPASRDLETFARRCREAGSRLALDLAYLPFLESPPDLPGEAIRIHAPNKSMGLVGVRAGYAIVDDPATGRELAALAPSWVVGTESVAFLEACAGDRARLWLEATAPEARALRSLLGQVLRSREFEVVESEATHLVARHPAWSDGAALAAKLRSRGVRVRDTTSMGLPGWVRLAARPESEIMAFDAILDRLLA